jgi:curved DNA-binding protein
MKFKDFYQILGVPDDASPDDIKRAYRRKARQYHPDVSKEAGAEERFKEINEAYDTLKDETRRAEYDQLKRYGFRDGDDFRQSPHWGGGGVDSGSFGNVDISELFESLFGTSGYGRTGGAGGAGHHRNWPQQGDDISLTVRVTLENAYRGGKTHITLPGPAGRKLSVNIPAGVSDGQQLRLKGQGGTGINGGPAGDLLLTVKLKPHALFRVEGNNIVLTVPVTPYEAAAGLKLNVPTLSGAVSLTIPSNTKSGSRMRLKGKGMPGAGDQIVVVQIQLPDQPSEEALRLMKQLDSEFASEPRAHFNSAPAH